MIKRGGGVLEYQWRREGEIGLKKGKRGFKIGVGKRSRK